ncbi:MAG: outer membrane beta-barrel protein [Candidatus Binataceae bacterium]
MVALLIASTGWAAGPAAAPTSASEQQRLDALSGQVSNLATKVDDTQSEVKKIEKEIVVAAPADANAKPQTVGEHVGLLEKNFGDFKTNVEQNLGVSIHGLVDVGYEHNFNQPNTNVNTFRAWDEDGFQLTQGNLHIEKDGTVGFVTDINFGQVANSISAATNYSNLSHVGGQFIDPTQYYLTYTAPLGSGISLQGGRFVTLFGAEIIPTYQNQNYNETRGLLFTLGEPLTHTGIQGSYTFNDYVSVTGGLNNGWDDPAANNNGGPTGEGELTLNTKDKSVSFVVNGSIGSQAIHSSNQTLGAIDPIFTWKPSFVPNLTLESEYLYASEDGPVVNGHSASWQGFAQYIVYDWNQYQFASRGEFFQDKDGARTNGTAQTLWELTQTVSYKVPEVTGLLVRLEYRHDNSNVASFTNNNFVDPVTGAQHLWHGQDTMSTAVIYAF